MKQPEVRKLFKREDIGWNNLAALKRWVLDRLPEAKDKNITFINMIEGFGMGQEFIRVYEKRYEKYLGIEQTIARSFAIDEAVVKRLVDHFEVDVSGVDIDDAEILTALGVTRTALRDELKELKWSIGKLFRKHGQHPVDQVY